MKRFTWITALLAALPILAGAASGQGSIELDDGSRIYGEVVDFDGGSYVIHSPTLGRLRIGTDRVRAIHPNAEDGGAAGSGNGGVDANRSAQLLDMQRQLMGAPDILSMITALQDDPQVRAALADPRLMRAVSTGNLDTLRNDPSFRALLSHPGIRAVIERVR